MQDAVATAQGLQPALVCSTPAGGRKSARLVVCASARPKMDQSSALKATPPMASGAGMVGGPGTLTVDVPAKLRASVCSPAGPLGWRDNAPATPPRIPYAVDSASPTAALRLLSALASPHSKQSSPADSTPGAARRLPPDSPPLHRAAAMPVAPAAAVAPAAERVGGVRLVRHSSSYRSDSMLSITSQDELGEGRSGRKDKSLGILSENFLRLCTERADDEIDLEQVAVELGRCFFFFFFFFP